MERREALAAYNDAYKEQDDLYRAVARQCGLSAGEGYLQLTEGRDRRSKYLTLTAAGETLMARTVDRVTAAEETAMDTLTAAERAQFLALCRRYNAALRQALSTAIEEKKE